MRKLGMLFVILGAAFFITVSVTPLKRLHELPVPSLEAELRYAENPAEGATILSAKPAWIKTEVLRQRYSVDLWMTWALVFGFLGLTVPFVVSLLGKWKGTPAQRPQLATVPEAAPQELYVDEFEFHRKIEDGFQAKELAVAWILKDPLRKCDYCGAALKPTASSTQESVQLVTFYKRVPDGAKDLRIVLGTYWFPRMASELKCSSCDRMIRR